MQKICRYCGKVFETSSNRQKYCSGPHCVSCSVCGQSFQVSSNSDLFRDLTCSSACRKIKFQNSCIQKFGVKNPQKSDSIKKKRIQTLRSRYGEIPFNSSLRYQHQKDKIAALNLNLLNSSKKIEFEDLLQKYHIKYQKDFFVDSVRFDFFICGQQTVVSIVSSYEVSAPHQYHRLRFEFAQRHHFKCIHIFDWDNLDLIARSFLPKVVLDSSQYEILFLRKKTTNNFLKENHPLGTCTGQIMSIALADKKEAFQIMTFGKAPKNSKHSIRLIRMCNKIGYEFSDGFNKLFQYATEDYGLYNMIAYSDNSKFDGSELEKLGMNFSHSNPPKMIWSRDNQMKTQQVCNWNHLSDEDMIQEGWSQVSDCGQKVFTYRD